MASEAAKLFQFGPSLQGHPDQSEAFRAGHRYINNDGTKVGNETHDEIAHPAGHMGMLYNDAALAITPSNAVIDPITGLALVPHQPGQRLALRPIVQAVPLPAGATQLQVTIHTSLRNVRIDDLAHNATITKLSNAARLEFQAFLGDDIMEGYKTIGGALRIPLWDIYAEQCIIMLPTLTTIDAKLSAVFFASYESRASFNKVANALVSLWEQRANLAAPIAPKDQFLHFVRISKTNIVIDALVIDFVKLNPLINHTVANLIPNIADNLAKETVNPPPESAYAHAARSTHATPSLAEQLAAMTLAHDRLKAAGGGHGGRAGGGHGGRGGQPPRGRHGGRGGRGGRGRPFCDYHGTQSFSSNPHWGTECRVMLQDPAFYGDRIHKTSA